MSAPQPPEAAVEAATARFPIAYWNVDRGKFSVFTYEQVRAFTLEMVNDALPHLHRDWLEGLIGKAEAEHQRGFIPRMFDGTPFPDISDAAGAARWLRAELAEGGGGE